MHRIKQNAIFDELKTKNMENQLTIKNYFAKEGVQKKFQELLGQKSVGFITSVMQVVNGNNLLQKATPESIYNAAAMAATLDLPINNNLGYAWIVPYSGNAQFQIGWKGFLQLAQRTGQYKAINVIEVYENQFKSFNRLSEELEADFSEIGAGEIVGFVAYFKLLNGFEKTAYWTLDEVKKHGAKFSKTFNSPHGVWKSDFNAMAKKTVLKNTLSKWGILSIEMQKAIVTDQSIINDVETLDVDYADASNDNVTANPTITDDEAKEAVLDGLTIGQMEETYTLSESQKSLFTI